MYRYEGDNRESQSHEAMSRGWDQWAPISEAVLAANTSETKDATSDSVVVMRATRVGPEEGRPGSSRENRAGSAVGVMWMRW